MKKEHNFLKVLCGVIIIFACGIIGTFIAGSEAGGKIGCAVGGLAAFFLFILRSPKAQAENAESVPEEK